MVSRLKTVVRFVKVGTPMILDVSGQKRAAARERVAAATPHETAEDAENAENAEHSFHCTTTVTIGPFATSTLRIVLPVV